MTYEKTLIEFESQLRIRGSNGARMLTVESYGPQIDKQFDVEYLMGIVNAAKAEAGNIARIEELTRELNKLEAEYEELKSFTHKNPIRAEEAPLSQADFEEVTRTITTVSRKFIPVAR